jgi:FkbM family methyltransferase
MQADTIADAPYGHYRPRGAVARILKVTRSQPESWVGRRVSYFLRRIAIGKLHGAPVDIDSLGARMRLYPYNNVCEKRILFTPQYFDMDERRIITEAMTDNFTFVDIGANIGGYSLFVAAAAGPRARVLAIEPQPKVFEKLVGNIRLNEFATIKAVACAVADTDGELTLFVDRDNQGGSSVRIVRGGGNGGNAIKVPSRTLLGLLEDERFSKVDAIKIDVEGAEDLVLEPFLRDAPQALWPRLLIVEHGAPRWHVDLASLLTEKGYRLDAKTRNNIVFRRD